MTGINGSHSGPFDPADPDRDLEKPLVNPHDVEYQPRRDSASISDQIGALQENWPALLQRILVSMKPWILSRSITSDRKLRPTAYLDGLRGWAAFHVYMTHHIAGSHMWLPIERAYGYDDHYLFVTIPFIRVLFTGSHIAVYVFFIISGYVLSRSAILQIHDGTGDIGKYLGSALFRRWVRLFTPVAVTTFIAMTIGYMINQRELDQMPTYIEECFRWLGLLDALSFPLSGIAMMDYNLHTWTIPVEFKGSILVFLGVLATHRMTKKARMLTITFLALWFHWHGYAFAFTFLLGIVLAEVDILANDGSAWPQNPWLLMLQRNKTQVLLLLLGFAMHVAGQPMMSMGSVTPQEYIDSPGFYFLGLMIPASFFGKPNDFWYGWGALFIVLAVTNLPFLKRLFEMKFTQYLGKISFGFYLVHGPIMNTLGMRLYHATGVMHTDYGHLAAWNNVFPLPAFGPLGLEFNFVVAHIILLPFTFWMAEICTKWIDEPSVKFARWIYVQTVE